MTYCHLTMSERSQIQLLLSMGASIRCIAILLERAPSTISREVRRNKGLRGYREVQAHSKAARRRYEASAVPRKLDATLTKQITELIQLDWSPEQVSGRLRTSGVHISPESIYKLIWEDKANGGRLYQHLRRQGKPANRSRANSAGRGCIPGRVDISQRPKIVDEKSRFGDFEADTVIGKGHQGALVTLVDRKTKYTLIEPVSNKTSTAVTTALLKAIARLPKGRVRTITFDNGKEFSAHAEITQLTGASCYFARPYHSWERGINEHTNGLVRQYFKKTQPLDNLSDDEVYKVEAAINNRPRKVLNFLTPKEALHGYRKPMGVALRC